MAPRDSQTCRDHFQNADDEGAFRHASPVAVGCGGKDGGVLSNLSMLTVPWVFSQSQPLSTSDFFSESMKRGVLSDAALAYRRGDLQPLVEITARPSGPARDAFDIGAGVHGGPVHHRRVPRPFLQPSIAVHTGTPRRTPSRPFGGPIGPARSIWRVP